MLIEFFQSNGWMIANGILFGVAYSKISLLKDSLDFKERMMKHDIEGMEKYKIRGLDGRIDYLVSDLKLINQRLTMEVDFLRKEVEELKKKQCDLLAP